MTPFTCAAARPSAIAAPISTASRQGGSPLARRARSVWPSSSSMTAKELAVGATELVDRHDAGVREGRDGAGLGLEALPHPGIRRDVLGHYLDRDVTRQAEIARPIDVTHPARAQRGNDFILSETGTGGEGHGAEMSWKLDYIRRVQEHDDPDLRTVSV